MTLVRSGVSGFPVVADDIHHTHNAIIAKHVEGDDKPEVIGIDEDRELAYKVKSLMNWIPQHQLSHQL